MIKADDSVRFGVLLNMGANLGETPEAVFDLTAEQATAAEQLGYDELWVTEHHFIRFGINPSAITTAAFLLGRTTRIQVGTAVVLSPLLHPVELAERAALLDQFSGGRFALGLGRGGYRRDYDVLGVDFTRWDDEPLASAQALLDIWARPAGDAATPANDIVDVQPPPLTHPHPELLIATSSDPGIEFAASNGIALQHYFATPVGARVAVENPLRRTAWEGVRAGAPAHPHHRRRFGTRPARRTRQRTSGVLPRRRPPACAAELE